MKQPVREVHYVMGTLLQISLFDLPEMSARPLLQQCFFEVRRLERIYSAHDPESDLSQLNRQAGCGPQRVNRELWHRLNECAALSQRTDGAFDICRWSDGYNRERHRADEVFDSPGPTYHLLRTIQVALDPDVQLDMGGIGKGIAVDAVVALLHQAGVKRGIVNFGESSLYLLGTAPLQTTWPVLVRGRNEDELVGLLALRDIAVSSSSSLRPESGVSRAPIRNPRTGGLIEVPCASTVLVPNATLAEALSTAILVCGATWDSLLARFPEAEGLYLASDGQIRCTEGFADQFQSWVE